MSVLSVFDGSTRALEIVRIVSRHEWSFLSQLLRNVSEALFVVATVFGIWLIVSLLRSSRR